MKKCFITCVLICFAFLNNAQYYTFDKYSVDQGLPHSQVFGIITDHEGNIWAATRGGGLCRFNGKKFEVFTKQDGLPSNLILAIKMDKLGNIWVITDQGISKYDGFQFHNFIQPGLVGAFAFNRIESSEIDNTMWFLMNKANGIEVWELRKGKFEEFTKKYNAKAVIGNQFDIYNISVKQDGTFLLLTSKGLFELLDGSLNKSEVYNLPKIKNAVITFASTDKKNGIWIQATIKNEKKTFYFNNQKFKSYPNLSQKGIRMIFEDSQSRLWFVGNSTYLYSKEKWTVFNGNNGFTDLPVLEVTEDNEGNIWFATASDGIIKYSGDQFVVFAKDQTILEVNHDKNDVIWLSTFRNGVFKLKNNKVTSINSPAFKKLGVAKYVLQTSKSNVLFSSNSYGLWEYNGQNLLDVNKKYGIKKSVGIGGVLEDGNVIWIGTYGKGVIKYEQNSENKTVINTRNSELGSDYIRTVFRDKNDNIWFGSNKSLDKWDGKKFTNYKLSGVIEQIIETKYNNMWLAIRNKGIFILENNEIIPLNLSTDFLHQSTLINSIIFDNDGNVWAGTNKGLIKIELNEQGKPEKVSLFNQLDGIRSGLEMFNGSVCKDNDGNLWFGTSKGALRYKKSNKASDKLSPVLRITEVKLFLKKTDWGSSEFIKFNDGVSKWYHLPKNLNLPYSLNHISFVFEGINYKSPEKVEYQYLLEGLDEKWAPVSKINEAVYANLSPGKYIFKLKASKGDGIWTEKPVVFSFEILPPWWQLLWVRAIMVIVLAGVIYLAVKFRLKQIIRQKEHLEKVVSHRTEQVVKQNKEIAEKNDELLKKTETLQLQKEEIESQNEELTLQHEEIVSQRDAIEMQNKELSEKNDLITQSIKAALYIQEATLPFENRVNAFLKDYFVLYRPRDIVSGDFYWIEEIDDKVFVIAVDCTGHGVPGAFMSMVANTLLDNIIKIQKIYNPAEILKKLHSEIQIGLRQKETGNDNGMDVAVCVFENDYFNNNRDVKILFAGAKRPLYYISSVDGSLKKIVGARKAIGGDQPINIDFKCTELLLTKKTMIYIDSDGYMDQNDLNRKKYGSIRYKSLLEKIHHLPVAQQRRILDKELDDHMEKTNQRDDILLIGFRV